MFVAVGCYLSLRVEAKFTRNMIFTREVHLKAKYSLRSVFITTKNLITRLTLKRIPCVFSDCGHHSLPSLSFIQVRHQPS